MKCCLMFLALLQTGQSTKPKGDDVFSALLHRMQGNSGGMICLGSCLDGITSALPISC